MSISLELLVSQLCKSEQGNNTSRSNNISSTGTGVNTSTVYETLGRQIAVCYAAEFRKLVMITDDSMKKYYLQQLYKLWTVGVHCIHQVALEDIVQIRPELLVIL